MGEKVEIKNSNKNCVYPNLIGHFVNILTFLEFILFYRVPKVCRHHWHPGPPFFLTFSFCRCIRAVLFCVFKAEGGSVSQQHSSTTVGPETAIFASALCSLGFTNFFVCRFRFCGPGLLLGLGPATTR